MPFPNAYPDKMRDDWDVKQAEKLGLTRAPSKTACEEASEKPERTECEEINEKHEDTAAADDSPQLCSSNEAMDEEKVGQPKLVKQVTLLALPESNGHEVEPPSSQKGKAKRLPEVASLLHELRTQRVILRQYMEEAFDAVESRIKNEADRHMDHNGDHAHGRQPPDSNLPITASVDITPVPSQCGSPRRTPLGSPRGRCSISTVFAAPVEWETESVEFDGHQLHRMQTDAGPRMAISVSEHSVAWRAFQSKMHRLGRYNRKKGGQALKWLHRLQAFTEHKAFELTFAILIVLNTVNMSVEFQYRSLDLCYGIGFPKCDRPANQIWHGADQVFYSIDLAFGFVFTIEVGLKFLSQHIFFFKSFWNYIDSFSLIGWYLILIGDAKLIISPLMIRLARIARLLRFLRLVKTVQMFDVLCLLIGSLKASCAILLWSALLLVLIMCSAALISHTLMLSYINDENLPMETRHAVYIVFGSFVRSFLTIKKLTFSLDTEAPEIVFELNEWLVVPLLLYQGLVSFAVMKVIEAVFLNETIKVAATNDDLMIMEKNRWEAMHEEKVKALFAEADASGDGYVDYSEFMLIMNDDKVIAWLEAMDVEIEDPRLIWELLCSFSSLHGGAPDLLNVQWFVKGIARLKGSAKSLDVLKMLRELGTLKEQIGVIDSVVRPNPPRYPSTI
eukprot:TRINITY_DN6144_c0_g2_i1.p1 TRINITY_DN6144_c0_g2~~TRINITY_DN6144_c0_g2_i1.p1  ORF type:complete len:675 (-),score=114.82 TRINITY_DN6144_c0_g2_i1:117-2141(-)